MNVYIYDTDRSLLMDVINDLYAEAAKMEVALPKNPTLSYSFEMKSWELLDDNGLYQMFSRFEEEEVIDIWVEEGATPSTVLQLARGLHNSQAEVTTPVRNVRQKQNVRRKAPIKSKSKSSQEQVTETGPVLTSQNSRFSPRRSRRISQEQVVSPVRNEGIECVSIEDISPIKVTQTQNTKRKSPRFNRKSAAPVSEIQNVSQEQVVSPVRKSPRFKATSAAPGIEIQNSVEPLGNEIVIYEPQESCGNVTQPQGHCENVNQNVTQNKSVTPPRFKMPKTTAKAKGVWDPKVGQSQRCEGSSRARTRSMKVDYEGSDLEVEDDLVSDDSYKPSDDEDGVVDDEVSDLEAEDATLLSDLDKIDDGYDPYETTEWPVEEEGWAAKIMANGYLYDDTEVIGSIKLKPWMLFMDRDHFKDILKDFCIQEGFHIIVVKSDKFRYTAECATLGCTWRIHSSVLPDGSTWAIKSIRNAVHGCAGVGDYNPLANAEWVSKKLIDDVRANPAITGESIQKLLRERYGLRMKTSTLYRMRDKALELINGGHDESYRLLAAYCEVVKIYNPGSYAHCAWTTMNTPERSLQFKSLFVSFHAQFRGLIAGCRPLIGVDGTHLKGNHGGVLLAAVAVDGNNEIFPVAVGIVDCEDKANWCYFFGHLKQVLAECGREQWTIISDRQKVSI